MPQQRLMKRRHQRRALPAVSHVAPAEIADGGDIGQCGDAVVVAELHGETRVAFRFVPYRLAVAADGGDMIRVDAGLLQQAEHRLAKQRAQLCVQPADGGQRGLLPLAHPQDLFFQRDRHRMAIAGLLRHHAIVNRGQYHIDSVQTGAGHDAYIAA
ncbi:Uncharacterised protein [Acinetobacter baumannii]|nr:Uncharacterised protein [Acinetobacter baumannii]